MEEIDLNDIKRRMENSVEVLKTEFSGLRTGRASANMFETINVNAYGQAMKLRDLATVSIPEAKLVSIQVWDAGNVGLIEKGMAKEQARCILPLTLYTEVYWTASFQAVMNFIELRNEKTAQIEIQEYAKVLLKFMNQTFPKTTKIWSKAHGWV